jgi:general secretion pathway protein A
MYKEFFGLNRSPFELSPDPSFLWPSVKNREALASIMYAIANRKGIVVLTGEVGTGKTMIVRSLFELWKRKQIAFANIVAPKLSVIDFLSYAVIDLGIEVKERSKGDLLRALHRFVVAQFEKGLTTVLVIDEAHQIPSNVLEEIRMLTNVETDQQKLVQVLLIGQPELDKKLDAFELRQLKQRIAIRCHLEPFGEKETRDYIERRLELAGANAHSKIIFPAETTEAIYGYSQGTPRVINAVCNQALITAHARQIRVVSVGIIDEVASYLRLQRVPDRSTTQPSSSTSRYRGKPTEAFSQVATAVGPPAVRAVDPEFLFEDVRVSGETVAEVAAPNKAKTSEPGILSGIDGLVHQELPATLRAQTEAGSQLSERDSRDVGRLEVAPPDSVSPSSGSTLSTAFTAAAPPLEIRSTSHEPPAPSRRSLIEYCLCLRRGLVTYAAGLRPALLLAAPICAAAVIIVVLTTGVILARRPNAAVAVTRQSSRSGGTFPVGQTATSVQPIEASSGVQSVTSVDAVAPRLNSKNSEPTQTLEHFAPRTNIISALSKPVLRSSQLSKSAEPPPILGMQTKDLELGKDLFDVSTAGPMPPGASTGGHLQPPKVISSPPPAYPSRAQIEKVQGVVVINALVDETGKVTDMKVISGSALLTQAAMEALHAWKYEPASLNGQPVATHIRVSIDFSLH